MEILKQAPFDLAVIDGFVGMEGEGPTKGEPVELRIALAGADPVAVDSVAASIMGFDPLDVGYVYFAAREGLGENNIDHLDIHGNVSIAEIVAPSNRIRNSKNNCSGKKKQKNMNKVTNNLVLELHSL